MADTTKSYRIRTDIGSKLTDDYITVDANLVQDYDAFDILSVSIDSIDTYKLHNSNYGVVVGRVLANNGFGIPNAKISIFIALLRKVILLVPLALLLPRWLGVEGVFWAEGLSDAVAALCCISIFAWAFPRILRRISSPAAPIR